MKRENEAIRISRLAKRSCVGYSHSHRTPQAQEEMDGEISEQKYVARDAVETIKTDGGQHRENPAQSLTDATSTYGPLIAMTALDIVTHIRILSSSNEC